MMAAGLFAGPWAGLGIDLALIAIGLVFCGVANLGVIGPPIARWLRRRRESGEARMIRAHAEWVRRIGHITFDIGRPAHPRRPPARPATWRPGPLFPPPVSPAAATVPPNRRGAPRQPPVVVPFPDRRR